MAIDDNKQKALAAALGQIEKQFGKGSPLFCDMGTPRFRVSRRLLTN